ncbi:MAG: branched-chain amino acid ABC transporter permease [Alphaproteobacteria bacterium]|jgi:branched-chain amino acid transport system permease protein|nr:branched-chain amino acid ABC transporter permease [Rhodospirillaceae bacterium]MDP6403893.1 branched-chain amino acid ABC transporter permease [Alphaproteobacteria bacterium]MDP6621807.1 branched-chain amino acid ABC transporter permease [Alphaproteobacteria bacterium]|tara:strand:- start:908 stop:1900 length:993 start_codon:yes stop_codon:yes gene_type:complete
MLHTLLARRDWNRLAWPVVAIVMLLLPLLLGDGFYLNILNFVALYAMVAVGLCLLVGYGGQLSISHSAFFAIGAYASAIFSLRWGWHPWFAVAGAQLVSAAIAWGIGSVVLRLRGHYLAIATLSFTIIIGVLIKELPSITGGLQGLGSIPPLSFGDFEIDDDWRFYYVVWPLMLMLLLFALNLVDSRLGRAFRAIKEGEDIARLFAVDIKGYKVKLFIISSVYASLSGSLFAHFMTFISPTAASVIFAIDIILVLAFGGFTMIWGAMLGVMALTYLNEYLVVFADYKRAVYGLALVVIMLFFPNGLLLGFRDLALKLWRAATNRRIGEAG